MDEQYESIREALPIVGKRVVEVTCDDWEHGSNPSETKVYLHFEDGATVSFAVGDGIDYEGP